MKNLLLLFLLTTPAFAKTLNVITTTTDLAWVTQKVGGSQVKVSSLLNGSEDAHYLDAKPNFIRKVSNADMVCFNGLALEIGWLPKVLAKSGNAQVQKGGKGHCDASEGIDAIERLSGHVDRSMGDVPEGNPHYSLSPLHLLQAAETIRTNLITLDTKNAEIYIKNFQILEKELKALHKEIKSLFSSHKKTKSLSFIQYHKEFSYFLNTYGLKDMGAIETVPGVPPSAGRLAEIGLKAKAQKITLALGANYAPKKLMKQFQKFSGVPYLLLPISMPKNSEGYAQYQQLLAQRILEKIK